MKCITNISWSKTEKSISWNQGLGTCKATWCKQPDKAVEGSALWLPKHIYGAAAKIHTYSLWLPKLWWGGCVCRDPASVWKEWTAGSLPNSALLVHHWVKTHLVFVNCYLSSSLAHMKRWILAGAHSCLLICIDTAWSLVIVTFFMFI